MASPLKGWQHFVVPVTRSSTQNIAVWVHSLQVLQNSYQQGIPFGPENAVAFIRSCEAAQRWELALRMANRFSFEGIGVNHILCWFQLMRCMRRFQKWDVALSLYRSCPLLSESSFSYTMLACVEAHQWVQAIQFFDSNKTDIVNVIPNLIQRALLSPTPERNDRIRLFASYGKLEVIQARAGNAWLTGLVMLQDVFVNGAATRGAVATAMKLLQLGRQWKEAIRLWRFAEAHREKFQCLDIRTLCVFGEVLAQSSQWALCFKFYAEQTERARNHSVHILMTAALSHPNSWKEVLRVYHLFPLTHSSAVKTLDALSFCLEAANTPQYIAIQEYAFAFSRVEGAVPIKILQLLFRHNIQQRSVFRAVHIARLMKYPTEETVELLQAVKNNHHALGIATEIMDVARARHDAISPEVLEHVLLRFSKSGVWMRSVECLSILVAQSTVAKKKSSSQLTFNPTVFGAVQYCLATSSMWQKSFEVYHFMQKHNVEPCAVSLRSVAALCIQQGHMDKAHDLLTELIRCGIHGSSLS